MNKITTTISMMAVIFFVSMPSHVSARSPIDDYFDELDAYDARMAEHKAQEPVVTSPLSFFNYSSQGVKQVEAAELVVTSNAPKVVSSDNEKSVNRSVATVSKKDEGEVILIEEF